MLESKIMDEVRRQIPELDYDAGLNHCMGDEDFYLELLTDFSEFTIKEELLGFFREKDAEKYCISVHGFKNNAYTVGAMEIGDLAFALEKLTKTNASWDEVRELQQKMFALYDGICERYKEIKSV